MRAATLLLRVLYSIRLGWCILLPFIAVTFVLCNKIVLHKNARMSFGVAGVALLLFARWQGCSSDRLM